MAKQVALDEVWSRLLPYRSLNDRTKNIKVYENETGSPFTPEEMLQFEDLVLVQYCEKGSDNPYLIAKEFKQYWPNRSRLSLSSRIYNYKINHQDEINNMRVMFEQWHTLHSLNSVLHENNLISNEEFVIHI